MNRYEQAIAYHKKGYNCSQSLLASFQDVTGLSEQASFDIGAGFGAGAFTGELCGALSGGIKGKPLRRSHWCGGCHGRGVIQL